MPGEQEDEADEGSANRGSPARISRNGEVYGSGSGAGGGGSPEDIDPDSASGAAGDLEPRRRDQPDTGADASNHGSR